MIEPFEQFWAQYPKRVGKGAARSAWEKRVNDDEDLVKKITLALEAQKRYRRFAENNGEFVPPWKHPSTWLNQECWLDEIPSTQQIVEKKKLATCSIAGCTNEIHGPKFKTCAEHIEPTVIGKDLLQAWMVEHGLWKNPDESVEAWQQRCREEGLKLWSRL